MIPQVVRTAERLPAPVISGQVPSAPCAPPASAKPAADTMIRGSTIVAAVADAMLPFHGVMAAVSGVAGLGFLCAGSPHAVASLAAFAGFSALALVSEAIISAKTK